MRSHARILLVAGVTACVVGTVAPSAGAADKHKLGPDAVPITADHTYLQTAVAPDYWAYSPYDKPQFTTSACSIASVTMALNGLRGLPKKASAKIPTQQAVLQKVGDTGWSARSSEGGDGVTYRQLRRYTRQAMDAYGMKKATITSFHPERADTATLSKTRRLLERNEATADNVALVYFNQGVLTGDWNGPHVSVVGGYDPAADRVLILDVDQEWYIPYWSPVSALVDSFVKPAPKNQGVLAGQTGGLLLVTKHP